LFDKVKLDQIARESGFLSRRKKLTPSLFLDLLFYGIELDVKSLERISKNASNEHSLQISKQALDKRFSTSSCVFVKRLLDDAITSQINNGLVDNKIQFFNTVKIKDSTIIEIDESLADKYEGFGKGGGPNSKAAVRIQFEFDFKNNRICDIDLKPALKNDTSDAIEKESMIKKGDLILRDLGYYTNHIIEGIAEKEAFFISKLYPNVAIRLNQEDKEKVDFEKLFKQMTQNKNLYLDIPVFVGKKKFPARMILVLMPDDVYEKRIRERNNANKTRGYQTSEEYRIRSRFNIFICNIPKEALTTEEICQLYHLRWQIELVFKTWKSIMKIEKFRKMKETRFTTVIYAKLLWIFINWNLFSNCRNEFYRSERKLLSIYKCFMTLTEDYLKLRRIFFAERKEIKIILIHLIGKLAKNHWIEKRKERYNIEEITELVFC
jgi:hypothetical protein